MQATIETLPKYLHKYVAAQPEGKYTPRDHAAWRYIMRQSRAFFREHAVPVYAEGLAKTGITLDRIPRIADIDAKLRQFGWGAVPVCGFIPPAAFLDFQAHKILPIAADMRSVDHIAYTPAPDIVHEAAGHAPILADPEYAEYLTMYAAMAQKAIFCQEDLDLYEAIRTLSDVKENPDCTPAMIAAAEANLTRQASAVPFVSEASKVARMNWWTVEYGLVGSLTAPKIYGAGLLSSVGESQACLSDKVKKLRLTMQCIETSYNITEPQPQLFVAESIPHLVAVLKELEDELAYKRGGVYGLREAQRCRTVSTALLDSGLSISGQLAEFSVAGDMARGDERVEFVRFSGPVQLGTEGRELPGQGIQEHASGFSTPLGRAKALSDRATCDLTDADLARLGLKTGTRTKLTMTSGFEISGTLAEIVRVRGKLVILKWRGCTVVRGGDVYFRPEWGDFDMGMGERIVSVYGGPADREAYGSHGLGEASTTPGRLSPFTPAEQRAFAAYADLAEKRTRGLSAGAAVRLAKTVEHDFADEWLLRLEALELARGAGAPAEAVTELTTALQRDAAKKDQTTAWLVQQGTKLAATEP